MRCVLPWPSSNVRGESSSSRCQTDWISGGFSQVVPDSADVSLAKINITAMTKLIVVDYVKGSTKWLNDRLRDLLVKLVAACYRSRLTEVKA